MWCLVCRVSIKVNGEKRYNPWSQPGTAPVYGEGCGLNGGNPNGCNGDYEDSSPFGTCCGGGKKNGQWKSGKYKLIQRILDDQNFTNAKKWFLSFDFELY